MTFDKSILIQIAVVVVIIILMWVLMRVNRILFREIRKQQEGLHLLFFERINKSFILISGTILALSGFGGLGSLWKTFLGGTAIISAVLAFAAQDVIKDVLGGLMISIYKPFEIGNRVELENGTTGIIQDITMRHVVIVTLENQRVIIPNSKLNAMIIRNYSYHTTNRSAQFSFHIAYGSDVEKAMNVIRQTVKASPYSIPGRNTKNGKEYGDVYFLAYEDSSLKLVTTVYYKPAIASEAVISDINLRVYHALHENGIEIPFPYINVVQKNTGNKEESQ